MCGVWCVHVVRVVCVCVACVWVVTLWCGVGVLGVVGVGSESESQQVRGAQRDMYTEWQANM